MVTLCRIRNEHVKRVYMLDAKNVDVKVGQKLGLKFGGKYIVDAGRLGSFQATASIRV